MLVEISRNLQHLPQLSCRADLIRKPFLALTITNQQVTWRFVIRLDLIVNLIVVIQADRFEFDMKFSNLYTLLHVTSSYRLYD